MINFFQKSKLFILFIVLINISALTASQIPNIPIVKAGISSDEKEDIMKHLFNEDGTLSYDAVIPFLDVLESGDLDDVCTDEDWFKINHFLAFLSQQGMMPDATEDEKAELEQDIQELLNPYPFAFQNSSYSISNDSYQILPAIFYGQADVILCKSWFSKQCKHAAKFINKHKTAVIIGAVIVIAAVAIVSTIVITSSAAASSVASIAAADSYEPESNNKETTSANFDPILPSDSSSNANGPILLQSFDDQITNLKNNIVQNDISSLIDQNFYYGGNIRVMGSALAHESLCNVPQNIQGKNCDRISILAHGRVDNAFATNQAGHYLDDRNVNNNSSNNFQEKFYYLLGQKNLNENCYYQAIDNFGKSIEANPNNHNAYLERAFAYFNAGDFDNSLKDYNTYSQQKNITEPQSIIISDSDRLSLAVAKGVSKGALESGKTMLSFAADTLQNPIHTSYALYKVYDNFQNDLAKLISECLLHPIDTPKEIYREFTDPNE